jgi:hypothetical protein
MKVLCISLFTIMLGLSALNAQDLAAISNDQSSMLIASTTEPKAAEYPSPSENDQGKWGYVDYSCNYVISAEFDYAYEFLNGFALVFVKDKYGYIGKDGKYVIEPIFDDGFSINEAGRTLVRKDHKTFLLDIKDLTLEEW